MSVELGDHQINAIEKLHNGAILVGGVGTGKSRTALAYYYLKVCNGELKVNGCGTLQKMRYPMDLYIITTAKKRDSLEWLEECGPFCIGSSPDPISGVKVSIDSWNNISKYEGVSNAFFIFDEQRVVGSGRWVRAFLKITKSNKWILVSATPADAWKDLIPVFLANGFYKNRTAFYREHVVFSRFARFPKIDRYIGVEKLMRLRSKIYVIMPYARSTRRHDIVVQAKYNLEDYNKVMRDRWDIYDNCPIEETGKLFYLARKVVNSDLSRGEELVKIVKKHKRVIVFYNFDYELAIIKKALDASGLAYSEWNGHKHQDILNTNEWVYIVQYFAGAEGWNCVQTDAIIFYSQSYSYRILDQAKGRIDRMNTKYTDLYYYHIKSTATIDSAISRAISNKKIFNERAYANTLFNL